MKCYTWSAVYMVWKHGLSEGRMIKDWKEWMCEFGKE